MTTITVTENQSIVTLGNIAASYENSLICGILEQTATAGISIDMISQSPATSAQISFAFTLDSDALPKLLPIINKEEKLVNNGNVKVTVKSGEMVNAAGFASKVFAVLKDINCLPLLITTGIDEISILVHESDKMDLERELRRAFA